MPLGGALVIRVTDVYGQAIAQSADISVYRKEGQAVFREPKADASRPLRITGLNQGPGPLFRVLVDAPSYWPVSAFVSVPAAGAELKLALPFRPDAVRHIRFAEFSELPPNARALLDGGTYLNLDKERKAGLLNIIAKSERVILPGGQTVLSSLTRLIRIQQDRLFAEIATEFAESANKAISAGLFRLVSGAMHTPPEGYTNGPSYKTLERFGNLQVTLFHCPDKPSIADIDIDNAAGLKHVFQVVSNAIHGPTHPFEIQAILLATQKIDTRYTLIAV
jgi:hypothetical protein